MHFHSKVSFLVQKQQAIAWSSILLSWKADGSRIDTMYPVHHLVTGLMGMPEECHTAISVSCFFRKTLQTEVYPIKMAVSQKATLFADTDFHLLRQIGKKIIISL